jgi:hypothetical protein
MGRVPRKLRRRPRHHQSRQGTRTAVTIGRLRLSSGVLQAFGKCVSPEISDGPVPIPSHTFADGPPQGTEDNDHIDISGWRFESVRVVRIYDDDAEIESEVVTLPEPSSVLARDEIEIGHPVSPIKNRRGGRYNTYQYSEGVLRALRPASSDNKVSAEQIYPDFYAEFIRQFPRDQYKITVPSVRTLRTQLLRFRKEPAETGNN